MAYVSRFLLLVNRKHLFNLEPVSVKYPLLIVEWEDHSEEPAWQSAIDVGKSKEVICTTIGWLVHENRKTIKLCSSVIVDDLDDTVGGTSLILKKNIVSRHEVEIVE